MNSGHTVFRQLLQYLPRHEFNSCTKKMIYEVYGDYIERLEEASG